jgi:hypothetical protein
MEEATCSAHLLDAVEAEDVVLGREVEQDNEQGDAQGNEMSTKSTEKWGERRCQLTEKESPSSGGNVGGRLDPRRLRSGGVDDHHYQKVKIQNAGANPRRSIGAHGGTRPTSTGLAPVAHAAR